MLKGHSSHELGSNVTHQLNGWDRIRPAAPPPCMPARYNQSADLQPPSGDWPRTMSEDNHPLPP